MPMGPKDLVYTEEAVLLMDLVKTFIWKTLYERSGEVVRDDGRGMVTIEDVLAIWMSRQPTPPAKASGLARPSSPTVESESNGPPPSFRGLAGFWGCPSMSTIPISCMLIVCASAFGRGDDPADPVSFRQRIAEFWSESASAVIMIASLRTASTMATFASFRRRQGLRG